MRLLCALGFHLGLVEMARLVLIRSTAALYTSINGKPAPYFTRRARHVWREERFLRCWCGRTPEAAC